MLGPVVAAALSMWTPMPRQHGTLWSEGAYASFRTHIVSLARSAALLRITMSFSDLTICCTCTGSCQWCLYEVDTYLLLLGCSRWLPSQALIVCAAHVHVNHAAPPSRCKKWVLYPPSVVPPGVHPSPDGADVATPVSIIEWFLNCYTAAQETKVGGT